MTEAQITAPSKPHRSSPLGWLLLLAVLAGGGWWLWHDWRTRTDSERDAATETVQRIEALESRIDALRRDSRAQGQRLQQADATNRVLRDELLGIGQRAALLEESVTKLADPDRHGAQALRLDEVELLLTQGQQRLSLSGDLDAARRAYALAAGVLDGVDDPAYLSLRQTLAQERAALDALGIDPKAAALVKLDAFSASMPAAPARGIANPQTGQSWWRRAFSRIIEVRPANPDLAIDSGDRAAAAVALQLELTLARTAIERRDVAGYRAALARADAWLVRLWPPSQELRAMRSQLQTLRAAPLTLDVPTLGSALAQLRTMRAST